MSDKPKSSARSMWMTLALVVFLLVLINFMKQRHDHDLPHADWVAFEDAVAAGTVAEVSIFPVGPGQFVRVHYREEARPGKSLGATWHLLFWMAFARMTSRTGFTRTPAKSAGSGPGCGSTRRLFWWLFC